MLSLSAAAGKMVIASDKGLAGQRVREHDLGWLFPSGTAEGLKKCMDNAALLTELEMTQFQHAAFRYAESCFREAFRNVPLSSFEHF